MTKKCLLCGKKSASTKEFNILPRNMSTNFFVNSGNVGVNTPPRLQWIDTQDIIHPQDISANSVVSSSTKSMCWRHILMFTPKRGMHVLIQNVIASINHRQSIKGISRDIMQQGNHQHAVNVASLSRKNISGWTYENSFQWSTWGMPTLWEKVQMEI